MNLAIGNDPGMSVAPLLQRLYKCAETNTSKPKQGRRYDDVIKNFGVAIYIIMGKGGYEMLRANLGCSLPHVSVVIKILSKMEKIKEGEFMFDLLKEHLEKWKSVPFVHIHLDDTRIITKIEYDPVTDRFVGFCLPLKNGLPICDTFVFTTFVEIEEAFKNEIKGKYAHVIVAKPITPATPSLIVFMMCTDSKYNHETIISRWNHVENGLTKRGIGVISNGSDGAGPFLKAMSVRTSLFKVSTHGNIPPEWSFYVMPNLLSSSLCSQDVIHLLAKLRNRLLMPSNIMALGTWEFACAGQLKQLLKHKGKVKHGLTQQALDNRDKQNYKAIEILLKDDVEKSLQELDGVMNTKGTVTYLWLMRSIRDSFLDKSISCLKRMLLMWQTVFFMRIWRKWLQENGYSLSVNFITQNVFVCTELNAHFLTNTIYNVVKKIFPPDALRVWNSGSQGCEEVFRLCRSMTPTFSTVINFTMKGVLERAHKLNFLSLLEASDEIVLPRAQRRLLQIKEESENTLSVPSLDDMTKIVKESKEEAIRKAEALGMILSSYDDNYLQLTTNYESLLEAAFNVDLEDDVTISDIGDLGDSRTHEEVLTIRDDVSRIFLEKRKTSIPTYIPVKKSQSSGRVYSLTNLKNPNKSPFVKYGEVFIRKVTALYILQENPQLSNDRLLRVRSAQPSHLFSDDNDNSLSSASRQDIVNSGELCVFKRCNSPKHLLGRVIQFSYLKGSKKSQQYSGTFVDTTKESFTSIGVLANYYYGVSDSSTDSYVAFKPLKGIYSIGYLPMNHYMYTIDESSIRDHDKCSFVIPINHISSGDPEWKENLTFDFDFKDDKI